MDSVIQFECVNSLTVLPSSLCKLYKESSESYLYLEPSVLIINLE